MSQNHHPLWSRWRETRPQHVVLFLLGGYVLFLLLQDVVQAVWSGLGEFFSRNHPLFPILQDLQWRSLFRDIALLIGGLVAFYFSWHRARFNDKQSAAQIEALNHQTQQMELTRRDQLSKRFTEAVKQLGDDKLPIRLGGISALWAVASESTHREDQVMVMDVLCAFIRTADWPDGAQDALDALDKWPQACTDPETGEDDWVNLRQALPKLRPDVALAFRKMTTPKPDGEEPLWKGYQRDLRGAYLVRVEAEGADLEGIWVGEALLVGATMSGANMSGANMSGANMSRADMSGANMSRADMSGANMLGANMLGAYMLGANILGVNMSGANMSGANMSEADMLAADMSKANMSRANMSRANMLGANILGVNMSGADMLGVDMSLVHMYEAFLSATNLSDTGLGNTNLYEAILERPVAPPYYEKGSPPRNCPPEFLDRFTIRRRSEAPSR